MTATTQNFLVPDMDCQSCVRAITEAVHAQDAGAQVTADLPAKRVRITGNGDFIAAIQEAGFSPSPA